MEKTILEQIGDRVAKGRMYRSFSRKKLAERAGVHVTSVIRMERGEDIPLEDIIKICNELGLVSNTF